MMLNRKLSAILAFFVLTICCSSFASEQDVLDLTDDDFATRVAEADTTLVMFYAPWYVITFELFLKN